MKMKWYIRTLILALTVFGIYQNKVSSPNQEISIQFSADEVTLEQSQTAIANIMQQLRVFGIEDIQVHAAGNGHLKITYFSTIDVAQIKKTLFEEGELLLDAASVENHKSPKLPSKKKSNSYNLDIYEIHEHTDGSGSAGKAVLIIKQDFDRFLNPNVLLPSNGTQSIELDQLFEEAFKVNQTIAFAINNTPHTIPEVRAGPSVIGQL